MDDEARQRVRMYERSKLRWYFAIAEFDSAATAGRVYAECDGHEFEESAITFDLRFVPDSEVLEGREVRATCCAGELCHCFYRCLRWTRAVWCVLRAVTLI